jgi:hypothetical protein
VPIGLAIFTEGNHFPVLLGGEIIEAFRAWARAQAQYAGLALDNIVIVTLPQPMIVGMMLGGSLALGNLTIEVSRRADSIWTSSWVGQRSCARLRLSTPKPASLPETKDYPC